MRAACVTPRLQAKRFEETILGQLRDHILTESNIRDLVGVLDEEMDGVAREQRQNLETIEAELEDVRRRLSRVWQVVENTDLEMADASERIKEHRDRQQRLEIHADEARAMLAERRVLLDSAETVAAFAEEMSEFLRTSEITETRAFVRSFAKGDPGAAGQATIHYTTPTPLDSPLRGGKAEEVALGGGSVLPTVKLGRIWWAMRDSNPRPLRCKRSALTS